MTKILYLEDEHFLGRIVKESIISRGYDVQLVSDGADFMRHFNSYHPDICILDVMVPNIDGFTVGKRIKEQDSAMPIIYLTAKTQTQDVLKGFQSGGNDYIRKPFSMEELLIRIENLLNLKINHQKELDEIKLGVFIFNASKYQLSFQNETIELSHRENELLKLFALNINQKLDRKYILTTVWGDDSYFNSRNLDVYIRKLRVYFEKDKHIQIKTLRGVGYYFSIDERDLLKQ